MNTQQLIEQGYLTPQGQPTQKLTQTLADGRKWQNYYTGDYTIIRRGELATLRSIRRQHAPKTGTHIHIPTYCQTCGTQLRRMQCDTFTYCPNCDLPQP